MVARRFGFQDKVREFAEANGLFPEDMEGGKLLVALSGGADSVALLLVLRQLGINVVAAHCNFHLRGAESDRDEKFVRELCELKGVALEVKDFDVPGYMAQHGVSVEMACRDLRYAWFAHLLSSTGCESVAVAHHRDDNIETFFLNALRGTGIAGLAGMHPRNGRVVRPLLCVSRGEIERYLQELGQSYVTDSTNLECDVKRNILRNRVLPLLETEFPGCRQALEKTLRNVLECSELYAEGITIMRQIVCDEGNAEGEMVIDADCLLSMSNPEMLLFEMLKPKGFKKEQCDAAVRDIRDGGSVGNRYESECFVLHVYRGKLKVLLRREVAGEEYVLNLEAGVVNEPVDMKVEVIPGGLSDLRGIDGKCVIALSTDVMKCGRVVLRHWHDGDRFSPYGLRGTKLVSDLFSDLHLEDREKAEAWILEADGEILWVLGYRASRHFSVSSEASSYLRVTLL
ncbi:MAG: tRNA lysidine(34) synthetase TilS [Muribaculaceae bacterium]|nr:tRNA lysidine(34) synthetase TilS [Muribaculaceae bacterium]